MQTVPIKLKRKILYKGAACTQNVRPHAAMNALIYLLQNSELYREANITINENWLETFQQEIDVNNEEMDFYDEQDTENHEPDESSTLDQTDNECNAISTDRQRMQ